MMMNHQPQAKSYLICSESVSEGHPDKICDQISDAILDALLAQDPKSRVACEALISQSHLVITGEITSRADVNYEQVARRVLREIGYNDEALGCDWRTCDIQIFINQQSPEIAQGMVSKDGLKAGDQGIMYGYAVNETINLMPLPITMAHELVKTASRLRKSNQFQWARPDMKAEVLVDIGEPRHPQVKTILMSIQHDPEYQPPEFFAFIKKAIIEKVVKKFNLNHDFEVLINPGGPFTIGGPAGDTGLTGRKIIVDTYGGAARHGGGCFSGKDSSKMDRTGAYMARYVAKNIVAAEFADECEITVVYAMGGEKPLAVQVNTFQTNKVPEALIHEAIEAIFDFRPEAMIEKLELRKPIFFQTATYGHFGRPHHSLPWERTDAVSALQKFKDNYCLTKN